MQEIHNRAINMTSERKLLMIAVLSCFVLIQAVDYEIIADREQFFRPCGKDDSYGNLQVDDYIDISDLTHVYTEDLETIHTNGNIVVKKSFPPDMPIKVEIEVLHRTRGQWAKTALSVRRDDLCKSFLSPLEIWYPVILQIPRDQRICPPKAGTFYSMINTTNRVVLPNMPTSDLGGRYKIISHFIVGNGTMCMELLANIYKINRKPNQLPGLWKLPIKIYTDVVNKTLKRVG